MNRTTFALFVALLIHILLILIFLVLGSMAPEVQKKEPKEKKIKISLKEMPKKVKKSGIIKKKVKPTPIAPPMPKGKQLKKIVKSAPKVKKVQKKHVKYKPKKPIKKPKLNVPKKPINKPKPIKKTTPKVEPIPPQKPYIPLLAKKRDENLTKKKKIEKKPKDSMAWMYEDKSNQEVKKVKKVTTRLGAGGTTKQMKELYGSEWGKLTEGQKQYMLDNQEIMRRITQQILTRVARVNLSNDLNVNRSNVIEFYLHPNGDMTDFKFLEKSGYYVLDDTTKETISYAYSRYPRPKEKILVRYNVFYNLARY